MISTKELKAKTLTNLVVKNGGSLAKTAKELGVTRQAIRERVNRPLVQSELQKTINTNLKKAGITHSLVYKTLAEELKAEKPIGATILVDKAGQVIKAEDEGMITVPDWQARDKAIDKCLKLIGHVNAEVAETLAPHIQVNIAEIKLMTTEQLIESLVKRLSQDHQRKF